MGAESRVYPHYAGSVYPNVQSLKDFSRRRDMVGVFVWAQTAVLDWASGPDGAWNDAAKNLFLRPQGVDIGRDPKHDLRGLPDLAQPRR